MDDDRQLVERFMGGDDTALEELVVRHQKQIYGYIYRMTQNMEDAKDLTQKVFINIMSGIRDFRKESSFKTWAYRIATNVCLNHIRQRRDETEMDESLAGGGAGVLSLMIERQQRQRVRDAVRSLPERQKTALILRAYEGLTCADTAAAMGCSEGAVKAHYHHAVGKLKDMLKEN
jgi:RNA polymerase sigma-70 factor (ECF subfamily)